MTMEEMMKELERLQNLNRAYVGYFMRITQLNLEECHSYSGAFGAAQAIAEIALEFPLPYSCIHIKPVDLKSV